jgi:tRNA(Ile)-lysidine synthase
MDLVSSACESVFEQLDPAGHVYVGFSGGMDSTVLLHALADRAGSRRARLIAVHVDHGLDPLSRTWRRHCEAMAQALDVPITAAVLDIRPGGNLEARARAARYQTFGELLAPGDVLALAHHAADRDESLLLHLLQGRGLFGMPARRPLGRGTLIRPLLALPRSTLEAYARARALEWLEDPANADPAMDRNFLRQSVLPLLHARFPGLHERLNRVVRHTADTEEALVESLGLDRHPLPLSVFNGLSSGAKLSVLRRWLIVHEAVAGIGDSALIDYLCQLDAANDRQPELFTAAGVLRRYRRHLYLVGPEPELAASYPLPMPGVVTLPHGRLTLSEAGQGLAIEPTGPLSVCFLKGRDRGATLRSQGHERRIRDCLREAGVPPWRRDSHPLVEDGAGIVAIADVAARDPLESASDGGERGQWRLVWEPLVT